LDTRWLINIQANIDEIRQGEIGELRIKGPGVMKGYFNRPEETRANLNNT